VTRPLGARAAEVLTTSLIAEIDRVLASVLRPGEPVALVNFPGHGNPGDCAIWLGERRALDRLGTRVAYLASRSSYDPGELRRALGGGTILFNGGGHFGDLYGPSQAATRARILADFPNARAVQLPVSVWFEDEANVEAARRVYAAHPDFTLLVRDRDSVARAGDLFSVRTRLCPDMALSIGDLSRPGPPTVDVLWLVRSRGPEVRGDPLPPAGDGVERVDWPSEGGRRRPALVALRAWDRLLTRPVAPLRRRVPGMWRILGAGFDPLARQRIGRGCRILSRGKVVVTDRLHAHLLATLMGIPNVVLDNAHGKVRAVYEAWTAPSPHAHWAETWEDGLDLARELASPAHGA
jgi:exopolysaccharide biosynthesis predicted pyruvyltransferase EpsI